MEATLIHLDSLTELKKIGFKNDTIKQLNTKYTDIVSNTPVITIDPGILTRSRANAVAEWSIDYSMGFEDMPRLKILDQIAGTQIPVEVAGPLPDRIGPIAAGIVAHNPGLEAVRTFMTPAAISTRVRQTNIAQAVQDDTIRENLVSSISNKVFAFTFDTKHLLNPIDPIFLNLDALRDKRPDWEKDPDAYKFPPGFPRTEAEKQLSLQALALLTVFKTRAAKISARTTQQVRDTAPSWRLPSADGINWQNVDQRFGYLKSADSTLAQADLDGRTILRDSLIKLAQEAGVFLGAVRQFVAADPSIFEQYWQGQLDAVTYQMYHNFDRIMSTQRWIVDDLKTQLSKLDFQQAESQRAVAQAQQQQDGNCGDVITSPFFWAVAGPLIVIGAAVVALAALFGGRADPYPNNPNDPSNPSYGPTRFGEHSHDP